MVEAIEANAVVDQQVVEPAQSFKIKGADRNFSCSNSSIAESFIRFLLRTRKKTRLPASGKRGSQDTSRPPSVCHCTPLHAESSARSRYSLRQSPCTCNILTEPIAVFSVLILQSLFTRTPRDD